MKIKLKKTQLTYLNKNGYEKLPKAEMKTLEDYNHLYLEFITKAKTEREAHDEAVTLLEAAGFNDLRKFEKENIRLKAGDRVYKSCSGK